MLAVAGGNACAQAPGQETAKASAAAAPAAGSLDHSGARRHGKASWYGKGFAGKTMADGTPMDPASDNAASKSLPLGTKAKVTNLDNGKSAVVEIRDRGPYVPGRIVDVSPHTARQLGLLVQGRGAGGRRADRGAAARRQHQAGRGGFRAARRRSRTLSDRRRSRRSGA